MRDFEGILNRILLTYSEDDFLEIIVKYSGDILSIGENEDVFIEILNSSFAIITTTFGNLQDIFSYEQINYVEIPKKLTLIQEENNSLIDNFYKESFICPLIDDKYTGKGVLVAILDTGIAYAHMDFRNTDGSSRILYIWDQTVDGNPPDGFYQGTIFNKQQIDEALSTDTPLGTYDNIGHGTGVAGICVGNGNESNGAYKGVAPDANIIVVKLGQQNFESFAMTTEFMRAIKYSYDTAIELNMPLVINISYGTNDGEHKGVSLFEEYLNDMISSYPSAIVVASGNEGDAGHHYQSVLMDNESEYIDFTIASGLDNVYLTLWKNFADDVAIELILPDGQSTGLIRINNDISRFYFDGITIRVIYSQTTPYRLDQEIYIKIDFDSFTTDIQNWTLVVHAEEIVDGSFDIWLPTIEEVSTQTAFALPSKTTTLTIPSTSSNVITVGGYNTDDNLINDFSGRGFTSNYQVKPDLVAPGNNILTTDIMLSYNIVNGTSFSSPFVTGACAALMQYGIIEENELFLYGEKLKAYLRKGATRSDDNVYPNRDFGYGTLCLQRTLDLLKAINIEQVLYNISNDIVARDNFTQLLVEKSENAINEIKNLSYISNSQIDDNTYEDFILLTIPFDKYTQTIQSLSENLNIEEPYPLTLMGNASNDNISKEYNYNNSISDFTGKGVLIGIIDCDIDIFDDSLSKNNKTKISYYYNMQTNIEISENTINNMLKSHKKSSSSNNYSHGNDIIKTALNMANDANLICVELKKGCQNFEDCNYTNNKRVFSSVDIIKAVNYINEKSKQLKMPVSICICLGTNKGYKDGNSMFEKYLSKIALESGTCISISVGNEADKKHHLRRFLNNTVNEKIKFNVCKSETRFPMYIYTNNLNYFSIAFKSPNNEIYKFSPKKPLDYVDYTFKEEDTNIIIECNLNKQSIIIKYNNPSSGVWEIDFIPTINNMSNSSMHIYLPLNGLISNDTNLITSSPNFTATMPSTAKNVISVGSYDETNNKISTSTSRGPSRSMEIKPTILAPLENTFCQTKGSSIATAEICGLCALILQSDNTLNTSSISKILIQNAKKDKTYTYPNNIEGYGVLTSKDIFE